MSMPDLVTPSCSRIQGALMCRRSQGFESSRILPMRRAGLIDYVGDRMLGLARNSASAAGEIFFVAPRVIESSSPAASS